jgi:Ca-activated chloride channel family protein
VRFQSPLWLLALIAIPLVAGLYWLAFRRRKQYAIQFTNLDVLAGVVARGFPWRRALAAALFLLALVAATGALARPQMRVSVAKGHGTVVLVIDTSGSMLASDVKPTRLRAAQAAIRKFLDTVPKQVRVGIVAFSTEPVVISPATDDRGLLRSDLEFLTAGAGTAIGDALAQALALARQGSPLPTGSTKKPPAAVVLLSDGAQTRGLLQPLQGARRLRAARIPVYTVALGTAKGVLTLDYGGFKQRIPVPPDPETLRRIAATTGGRFYAARDASRLSAVYKELGTRLARGQETHEVTYALVAASAVLLAGAGGLSLLSSGRLP